MSACTRNKSKKQDGQVYNQGTDTLPTMEKDGPMEVITMYSEYDTLALRID